ncbi:hypothetical protein KUW19_07715 [Ferrimonas balearica]|uniref:hypothetical protein n=1 Tax=Ferrimonas balearica TaxID=44012 RepID=UPI001C98D1F1|nr:hypothetical protein [Ferrimonas balearica]MBY6106381.1 hypothetical protein [Ferrimonas balearica]
MMNRVRFAVLASLALTLTGCGSDDNTIVDSGENQDMTYDNFHFEVDPSVQFNTEVSVFMGQWFPCSTEYPEYCLRPGDAKPISEYSGYNKNNKLTRSPAQDEFKVSASLLHEYAKKTGNIPLRKDIFAPGQFSVMDMLVYLGDTREDLDVKLLDFDEKTGTYPFLVSYDYNRDGKFDIQDGELNFENPDWYVSFIYTDGIWKRGPGSAQQEPIYQRLDEFVLRNDMFIRVRPFSPELTERRTENLRQEVERLNQNGGKTVVSELRLIMEEGAEPIVVAKDFEVKPHNLRPDLFQPGVITVIDALMSAEEQGLIDAEFTYWPTLHTKANIHSYAISSINGIRTDGMKGWSYKSGAKRSETDFFWAPFYIYPTPEMLIAQDEAGEGFFVGKCQWLTQENGGKHTIETAQLCIDSWYSQFGGNDIHVMTDMAVMNNPREVITLSWNYDMYDKFEVTQRHHVRDGKYEVYDVSRAVAPLDETHFGWKVADCGVCHSIDNIHLNGGDSLVIPDVIEPYYCASCHGSNGAPEGHGETARCYWCHSEDKIMVNHGDASSHKRVDGLECQGTTAFGDNLDRLPAPCADYVGKFMVTHDQAENASSYPELVPNLTSPANSDWTMSEAFPDPYSCATCHPDSRDNLDKTH